MRLASLMLSGAAFYHRTTVASFETWLQGSDAFQIHSFTPCDFLPITRVGTREGWHSCFDKRHDGFKAAWRTLSDFDWFLCCSCDAYFWIDRIRQLLTPLPSDVPTIVGAPRFDEFIHDGTFVRYPPGGAGYCLNRIALSMLLHHLDHLRDEWRHRSRGYESEDVFVGWASEQLKLKVIENLGFHQVPPGERRCNRIWPQQTPDDQILSIHDITHKSILRLHAGLALTRNYEQVS